MVFNSLITPAGAYEPRVYACSCKFPISRLMLKALRPAVNAYMDGESSGYSNPVGPPQRFGRRQSRISIVCAAIWRWKKSFNGCAMISP